jgi:hypothetical protein
MTLPVIAEIVIGTAYAYLIFSLIASGLNEVWARWTNRRAKVLERSISPLLGSSGQCSLASAFSSHPLIAGLATDYRFPSYVPPAHFALVLIDLAIEVTQPSAGVPGRAAVRPETNTGVRLTERETRVVESLIACESNIRVIEARIEKWFTDSAERISGSYKRASYKSLLLIAVALCFAFGFDSIRLVSHLYTDPADREVIVNAARSGVAAPASAKTPAIPIGWQDRSPFFVLGCLISALAIAFGAPFWFDILNMFVNLRQTGDPPGAKRPAMG